MYGRSLANNRLAGRPQDKPSPGFSQHGTSPYSDRLCLENERPKAIANFSFKGDLAQKVQTQLDKRMGRWTQEWLEQGRSEGIEEGIEQGRLEGMADQRVMLVRLAAAKFGSAAEGFDALLAAVRSSEALAEIGEWLLESDTAGELAAKVRTRAADATT